MSKKSKWPKKRISKFLPIHFLKLFQIQKMTSKTDSPTSISMSKNFFQSILDGLYQFFPPGAYLYIKKCWEGSKKWVGDLLFCRICGMGDISFESWAHLETFEPFKKNFDILNDKVTVGLLYFGGWSRNVCISSRWLNGMRCFRA